MEKAYARATTFRKLPSQLERLRAFGITDKNTYVEGRQAETLSACFDSFHGTPGTLYIPIDGRVFAESRGDLLDWFGKFSRAGIVVVDISDPDPAKHMRSDKHWAEMIDKALRGISGSPRVRGSKKYAKWLGTKGGKAKAEAATAARDAEVPASVRESLAELRRQGVITWRQFAWIMRGTAYASMASLQRIYGSAGYRHKPPRKGKK